jgi:hypothetical protein
MAQLGAALVELFGSFIDELEGPLGGVLGILLIVVGFSMVLAARFKRWQA